ncbi:MAG TPA: PDR/VanB family oxidoreductase [Trebonia sp.]
MTATLRLVVVGVTPVTEQVRQLTLAARDGGRLPSYPPGSHLGLRWQSGQYQALQDRRGQDQGGQDQALQNRGSQDRDSQDPGGHDRDGQNPGSQAPVSQDQGGPDRVNSYSLTGDGDSPASYTVSVLRTPDSRGGSAWAHRLRPGDPVDAVPPRSSFPPAAKARRHLLVAGGIGITPLLAHARWHRRWGGDFTLYYAYRPGRAAHLDELRSLCGDRLHAYPGRDALWAELGPALRRQPLGTQLYVCGPLAMIDAVTAAARAGHWAESRLRYEAFGVAPDGPRAPFRATLATAGRLVNVTAGETLLEALERSGVPAPSLCRSGVCGECRTPVSGGRVDHRDLVLSPEEKASGRWIMPCVSRADGDELELAL